MGGRIDVGDSGMTDAPSQLVGNSQESRGLGCRRERALGLWVKEESITAESTGESFH